MESAAERIVQKCVQANLIDEDQREWLLYSLQLRLSNIGGFLVLMLFGVLIAPLPQVLLLNIGLAFLREKTNGLHMPTRFSCFAFSLVCEYLCLFALRRMGSDLSPISLFLLLLSSFLILWLAPCNNSEIHCSDEELQAMRRAVHKRLALYGLFLAAFWVLAPGLVNTLLMAEAAVALLVVLAKIGVGIH